MSRKREDPIDRVVAFFETEPIGTAETVLTIVRGIMARRLAPEAKPKPGRRKADLRAVGATTSVAGGEIS